MQESIPFHRPSITQAEQDAVAAVLRSGWLTTGPKVKELEAAVAAYVTPPPEAASAASGVDPLHAVAVSSCTAALHLALIAVGVKEGDEVITSPYTFVATGETILYLGARPVFVDVEPGTKNMDPALLPAAITPRTRAIVTVSMAGHPCRAAEIAAIAHHHKLPVIEDAAHSLTSQIWGVPVGTQADLTCFSFYATKGVTAGEGGMVVTSRANRAERIRRLSLHGLSAAAWGRYDEGGWWEYDVTELGYKYNMTDIQAALAVAQMGRAEWMRSRRETIAERYAESLSGVDGLRVPGVADGMRHAWHLYQIAVARRGRTPLARGLREDGIGTSVHFKPLHLFPWYQERLGLRPGQYPVAEACYEETLSLPIWPDMTTAQVDRVVERVRFHMAAMD
jgi:dTDP-4-amino-4,6-dideoxygalactose transaminase